MDFSIPADTQRMVQSVRDFVRREVCPLERDFLNSSFVELLPTLKEKRDMVKKPGLDGRHRRQGSRRLRSQRRQL